MSTHHIPAARKTEERRRDFADLIPVMIWTTDSENRCDYINCPWVEFTGRPREMELGFGWMDIIHPDDLDRSRQTFLSASDRREPFRMEYRARRHDGAYRWILDSGTPRFGDDGAFMGYVGSCTDISDYKELAVAMGTAREQAEAAVRARSEFLANISHELRTPLNAILGFAEAMTLGIGGAPSEKHGEYLSYIQKSGSLLLGILNDLIDLSKIDAGQEELQFSAVSVESVVSACCAIIRPRSDTAGLVMQVAVPADLPRVMADERRMKQALLNLLSNAVKFTLPGGRIRVFADLRAGGGMEIGVKDTGSGIDKADMPRAMEPFGQVGRADVRNTGGAGLGLPLTKRLMELHGGRLEIESRPGRGTTARLVLPASRVLPSR